MSSLACIPGNGSTGDPCAANTDCTTGFKCCPKSGAFVSAIGCVQVAAGGSCPMLP